MATGPRETRAGSANVPVESVYIPVTFTNLTGTACFVVGGEFTFVAADGKTVVGWGTSLGGGFITLAPQATLTTTLQVGITAKYDQAVCKPQAVSGIRVQPPSDPATSIIPSPFPTGCIGNVATPGTLDQSQMVATPLPAS